jgi:cytochrome b561
MSVGLLVFALMALRLFLRLFTAKPLAAVQG